MATRLCIKHELGCCPKYPSGSPQKLPKGSKKFLSACEELYLKNGPITLRCRFDCDKCCMKVYLED
jgi:hypothetical protein